MKILIAPDKFKGSLTAYQVSQAIAEGIALVDPTIEAISFPLADGGDGTAAILTYHARGRTIQTQVHDPLMRPTIAKWGLSADGNTAFLEMAQASGLHLLAIEEQNCFYTTSYGTGELILAAIRQGATEILMGIGGSATNDGGMGMAMALGYRFLDWAGNVLEPVGKNLLHVRRIDTSQLLFNPANLNVRIACDVNNPLTGPQGASFIYGPQKGASSEEIDLLDQGLGHFAQLIKKELHCDVEYLPGSGAAGGMGAGAIAFLHAQLISGIELVMNQTRLDEALADVDLIITGEGKIDDQTLNGKVVKGIAAKALAHHIPIVALCGTLDASPATIQALGLSFVGSIIKRPCTLAESKAESYEAIRELAFSIVRFFVHNRQ